MAERPPFLIGSWPKAGLYKYTEVTLFLSFWKLPAYSVSKVLPIFRAQRLTNFILRMALGLNDCVVS